MQQGEPNDEYQQPTAQAGGAPYHNEQQNTEAAVEPEAADAEPSAAPQDAQDDSAVLRWQGPEYILHDRDRTWYIVFGVVTLALMALSIFVIQSVTFTILIPVMVAALFVYIRRAPQDIQYIVSRKGMHVNDRIYVYDTFKAFSVVTAGGHHSVILIPRKRFHMALTAYFPEEVGEPLVDMLAARLPMQTYSPDLLDKILAKLRI